MKLDYLTQFILVLFRSKIWSLLQKQSRLVASLLELLKKTSSQFVYFNDYGIKDNFMANYTKCRKSKLAAFQFNKYY